MNDYNVFDLMRLIFYNIYGIKFAILWSLFEMFLLINLYLVVGVKFVNYLECFWKLQAILRYKLQGFNLAYIIVD